MATVADQRQKPDPQPQHPHSSHQGQSSSPYAPQPNGSSVPNPFLTVGAKQGQVADAPPPASPGVALPLGPPGVAIPIGGPGLPGGGPGPGVGGHPGGHGGPGGHGSGGSGGQPGQSGQLGQLGQQQGGLAQQRQQQPGSGQQGQRPTARPGNPLRGRTARAPRKASLQIRRFDPWSVLKLSLVLSVAMFLMWLVAVGVLYGVLDGMGVWDKLNGAYSDLASVNEGGTGSGDSLISAGRVFGVSAVVGAVNIVLFTAFATVSAFVYNVSADLAGGVEITLSERD